MMNDTPRPPVTDEIRAQFMAQMERIGAAAEAWRDLTGQPLPPTIEDALPIVAADDEALWAYVRWLGEWDTLEEMAREVLGITDPKEDEDVTG